MKPRFQPALFEPLPHDKHEAIQVVVSASVAFAVMLVDFVWLIRDEAKHVWPKLGSSWTARLYVLTRYLGMATQIYNLYFAARMYLGIETSPYGCRIWFTYQAAVVLILLLVVQGLLMQRTYALFLRNRFILMTLISFAIGDIASMVVSARLAFPSNQHTVTCMMVRSNPGNAFFSATAMVTNALIFFMGVLRIMYLPMKWIRQRVGRVIMRDSALSLFAIIVMLLFLTLCSLEVIRPALSGNISYYWLVCVLWVSIGRMIVNHEKLPRDSDESEQGESNTWAGTLQLTSQIEMGQSELALGAQSQFSADAVRDADETSGTLQDSISTTPVTKESQRSPPPSACASDNSRRWLGDRTPPDGRGPSSPQPSSTALSREVFVRRTSLSNICTTEGDPTRPNPPADDAMERAGSEPDSRRSSPQPSLQTSRSRPSAPGVFNPS